MERALEYFEQAIKIDPSYTPVYAGFIEKKT